MTMERQLSDLSGIGGAMMRDLDQLGIHSVAQLAQAEPEVLYRDLSKLTGRQQDICVLDVFRCAVAQAKDPELPAEQRQWWWWSRRRKVFVAAANA